MRWQGVLAAAVVAVGIASCAVYPPEQYGFATERNYTLDAGDQVRIVVYEFDTPQRNALTGVEEYQVYDVSVDGYISLPVLGPINVRAKTVRQVERMIASRLRGNIVREPMVAVQVMAYRPVFVAGAVKSGGQYPFTPGLTVESAVAIAGGYTVRAYLAEARVVRQGPDGSTIASYVPGSYPVHPGDKIYVSERLF